MKTNNYSLPSLLSLSETERAAEMARHSERYRNLVRNVREMRQEIARIEANPDCAEVYFLSTHKENLQCAIRELSLLVAGMLVLGYQLDPMTLEWVKRAPFGRADAMAILDAQNL